MFIIKNNNIFNVSNVQRIHKDKDSLILSYVCPDSDSLTIRFHSRSNASDAYEALVDAIMSNRSIRLEEIDSHTVLHYHVGESVL